MDKITAKKALWLFLWHGHLAIVTACFFFYLAAQTTRQVSDFWVRWWVQDKYSKYDNPTEVDYSGSLFYSMFYLLLVGIFWIMMVGRGATFFWFTLRSGERMRRKALHK